MSRVILACYFVMVDFIDAPDFPTKYTTSLNINILKYGLKIFIVIFHYT